METKHEFTRPQLVKAFAKWSKEYLANPDDFAKMTKDGLSAEGQADCLLNYLSEVGE